MLSETNQIHGLELKRTRSIGNDVIGKLNENENSSLLQTPLKKINVDLDYQKDAPRPRSCIIMKDTIYHTIEIPGLLAEFIDTPEFQRLRSIKQLGAASYVFPSTHHTRFEHSIGVAHLAMKLLRCIARRQPDLK